MNYHTLTKKLRKLGCEFVRQGVGSHEIWWNSRTNRVTAIPFHGSRDLKKGTLRAILRDLDITPNELAKA
ncbi:MAG: type II toxin-antitoxin system HicA family toxin [Chloroflexi bacterium]|nr:type II toxin-antitoxin system HicA family toxin [Chloroflexota bacterium]